MGVRGGGGGNKWPTYVHHVVKHYKRRSLCLRLIPDAYLPYAPVATEEVVQVFARDLVVQILDEEDAVGARWQFGLKIPINSVTGMNAKINTERTVGLCMDISCAF